MSILKPCSVESCFLIQHIFFPVAVCMFFLTCITLLCGEFKFFGLEGKKKKKLQQELVMKFSAEKAFYPLNNYFYLESPSLKSRKFEDIANGEKGVVG